MCCTPRELAVPRPSGGVEQSWPRIAGAWLAKPLAAVPGMASASQSEAPRRWAAGLRARPPRTKPRPGSSEPSLRKLLKHDRPRVHWRSSYLNEISDFAPSPRDEFALTVVVY
jgi:hypothetical protein